MHRNIVEICREHGVRRLEIAEKAKSVEEWVALWHDPPHAYLFNWGDCWKATIEYRVEDFSAEIGFWIDIVALECNVLSSDFAMVLSPDHHFCISIKRAEDGDITPANAISIQFMLKDVCRVAAELEERGVHFEKEVAPETPGGSLYHGVLRTPSGIAVELYGVEDQHSPE